MHTTGYLVVPLKSVLLADRTIIFYEWFAKPFYSNVK